MSFKDFLLEDRNLDIFKQRGLQSGEEISAAMALIYKGKTAEQAADTIKTQRQKPLPKRPQQQATKPTSSAVPPLGAKPQQ